MDRLSHYDYVLPPERIAQEPLADRSASRLLHLDRATGKIAHRTFRDLLDLLEPGDLLVLNDTRVTARRLQARKATGGSVEVLLLREIEPGTYEAMVRPNRRLPAGAKVQVEGGPELEIGEVAAAPIRRVRLMNYVDAGRAQLRQAGTTPLPPYIHRALADPERYQTVYAQRGGSAAAPTAGLHFTPELLAALEAKGVHQATVTLDVSLDTFRPVEAENLDEHVMHGETAQVSDAASQAIRECRGRIVAVGTTVVRTLESFAVGPRLVESGSKSTRLFIRPGYRFQVVDGLLTNFHLPRTTMLVLVSSFVSRDRVFAAYDEALGRRYRFLSFGDAMLLL